MEHFEWKWTVSFRNGWRVTWGKSCEWGVWDGSVGEDGGGEERQWGFEVSKELEFHQQTPVEQQAVRKQRWQCQIADKNTGAFQFHWKGEVLWQFLKSTVLPPSFGTASNCWKSHLLLCYSRRDMLDTSQNHRTESSEGYFHGHLLKHED